MSRECVMFEGVSLLLTDCEVIIGVSWWCRWRDLYAIEHGIIGGGFIFCLLGRELVNEGWAGCIGLLRAEIEYGSLQLPWLARSIDDGLTECGSVGPEGADIRMMAICSKYDDETYNRKDEDNETICFRSIEHST